MLMGSLKMEEEKQLDFNRPLISIRRPTQTSESESKTRSFDSVTNKIPPSSPPVYKSDIKSGPVRNPGTVPFQWEHKPGEPKDEKKPNLQCFLEPRFVPKLPPGRTRANHQTKTSTTCDESDDTYLDANDKLSRSESFFFNCSNVSGLDDPGLLVEPFGSLSSDRQTQELMMGRFLPAAKALTSETARKPPKPEEPPRQNKVEQNPYRFHHSPNRKEEDGDMSRIASGVCGLAPQICLRSSFGLLNPVPSVRAVSVRRMRSKYQDSTQQSNETVKKLNESVAQGLENFSAASRTKISKNFGELLASDDDNTWKHSSEVAEKTLYVDIVHSVDKKVQEETKEQSLSKEYQNMIGPGEEQMNVNTQELEECPEAIVEITKEKNELEVQLQSPRLYHHRSSYHSVPPPPLPKAPSDSWLKRTLPTIPSKNSSFLWLQSLDTDDNHFTKIQENPKWETMVKTSNTHHQGFVCFSKETLNSIPEA